MLWHFIEIFGCMYIYIEKGFCNSESTDEGRRGVFNWSETAVESDTSTTCMYGPSDLVVTRFCVSQNNLTNVNVEECRTVTSTQFTAIQNVMG